MCCFWPAINNKQTFLAETAEKVKQEGTNAPSHLAKNFNKILGIKTKAEDLEEAGQCTAVQQWQCSVCGVAGDGPPVRGHQRIFLGSHLLWWRSALCQSAVMCLSRLPSTQYQATLQLSSREILQYTVLWWVSIHCLQVSIIRSHDTLRRDICLVTVGSARLLGGTDLSDYNRGVQYTVRFPELLKPAILGLLCFALRSQLKSSASLSVNLQSFSQINLFNTFSNKSLKNLSHCLFIIYRWRWKILCSNVKAPNWIFF